MIHIFPMALRCENGIGILRFAARAVVAAQGHEHVAAFAVQVVAQDDAAKAQVGLHVKEFAGVAVADDAGPERHDLHVAARADDGDGVFAKAAFYLDEAQHERGFQPGAAGFVPDGLQKVHAAVEVGHALVEAVAHGREPAQVGQARCGAGKDGHGRGAVGDGRAECGAHGVGQRLFNLPAGARRLRQRQQAGQ